MKKILKESLPYLLIIVVFIIVSFVYFSPVLEGKVMSQGDTNHATGTSNELTTYESETGEYSQWTNSIFGGMPAYNIRGGRTFNVFYYLYTASRLGLPYFSVAILFLNMLGFFVLLCSFKTNKWLSMIGAIAFALSSYNIIIIIAGHITKAYAIAFMAPALAGILLLFDKKYILGGIVTTLALGMQLATNHPQISYYTILMLGIVVIAEFFILLKEKELKHFLVTTSIIVLAGIFAVLPNITSTWTNFEYQKYSIRGASELASVTENGKNSTGLDKDYAMAWSYGVGETMTLLIPNAKGGESGYILENEIVKETSSEDFQSFAYSLYQQFGYPLSSYWGDQPFTSGPVYFGSIIIFLFILGLFIVKSKLKWGLLAATIISVMLSWGNNFSLFNDLFFNYFPLYNKFRTVSMTLVIASVTIPLLAFLSVKEMIENPEILKTKKRDFFIAFGVTGGLTLILWLIPGIFNYISAEETTIFDSLKAQSANYVTEINGYISELEKARIAIFKADAIRSFVFILLGAASLVLFSFGKIKKEMLFGILGLLIVIDLWSIDKRYLNNDDFYKKSKAEAVFDASSADLIILKDTDPNYRVVNLNYRLDQDGYTCYYHKTISGYHGAKMRRYQDLIDTYLNQSLQVIIDSFQDTISGPYGVLESLQVLNMLNTKYIIYNPDEFPLANMNAFGNAWFVEKFEFVESADDELSKLGEVNLKRTAVINKSTFSDYISKLPKLDLASTDTGTIKLTEYKPDNLTYKTSSEKDEFAVFSEIYYPKGWTAYIDDQEAEIICVNYVLRGLTVPAGDHIIEFKFKPASYYTGKKIAFISSMLFILFVIGFAGWSFYKKSKKPFISDEKNI